MGGEVKTKRKQDIADGNYKGEGYKVDQVYGKMSADELVKIGWSRYVKIAGVGERRESKYRRKK